MTDKEFEKRPKTNVTIDIKGESGNAFAILGTLRKALVDAGYDKSFVDDVVQKATSGDYERLLAVAGEFIRIVG